MDYRGFSYTAQQQRGGIFQFTRHEQIGLGVSSLRSLLCVNVPEIMREVVSLLAVDVVKLYTIK